MAVNAAQNPSGGKRYRYSALPATCRPTDPTITVAARAEA